MYALYKRVSHNGDIRLIWDKDISLVGCHKGIIPGHLRDIIKSPHKPPIGWVIPVTEKYRLKNYSVIVDIKPDETNKIYLCELDVAFGFCYDDRTLLLLRLINLFPFNPIDKGYDKYSFVYPKDITYDEKQTVPVYVLHVLKGSLKQGNLTGPWTFANYASTSMIFEPEAMQFFNTKIRQYDPDLLESKLEEIS